MTEELNEEIEKLRQAWPLRYDFYSSVGQAISTWASMETHLVSIASHLLDTSEEKTGLMLYSIQNFHAWLNIIDELFSMEPKFEKHRDEWTKISANLRTWNDTRLRLAHNTVWSSTDPTPMLRPGIFDSRSKSRKHKPLENAEIAAFIGLMVDVVGKVGNLALAMRAIRHGIAWTSPDTPASREGDPPSGGAR